MDKSARDFSFAKLSDLDRTVTVRISQLEGTRTPRPFTELLEHPELRFAGVQQSTLSDIYVACQIVADNKPLTIPHRTSFKAFKNSYTWNEWITFPLKYKDLPLNAQITFTVFDIEGPRTSAPVGGTTFRMFGKKSTLRRGKHRLLLWAGQEADGSAESRTPSKVELKDEMGRLEKLVKKYERGDLPKSEWLDKMAFRRMEEIHASETAKSESLFLYIDLPRFDFPVLFTEPEALNLPPSTSSHAPVPPSVTPVTVGAVAPLMDFKAEMQIWGIVDPDIARENPVEDKHRRLVRGHRGGPLDRELKPDAKIRDELTAIVNYPPTQPLSSEDKDLVWKFRFYLTRDPRALTKFLKMVGKMYGSIAFDFMRRLGASEDGNSRRDIIRRQGEFLAILSTRAKETRASKDAQKKKAEKFRAWVADAKNGLLNMSEPLPLPLNARVMITGVIPEKCSVLNSNLVPLLLAFKCVAQEPGDPTEYSVIYKNGDDMRQDQLVIQLFTLMDRLLRKENLDLKLTPYAVLATSILEGMVQFIPSKAIRSIMVEYSSVLGYLRAHNADEGSVGTYGVKKDVIETFVRSCAGYCVVTYILGVGDRHLDNLLVSPDGHFFHVDFGYILGRDPKPFPPPVKVCKEMVDAMGGAGSAHYAKFKNYCFTAFSILRKSANLILNLVALMVDANIPDIKHRDVHEQVQE
ncbi:Phosphatidylinositol (PI) 3-kinase, partial [Ceratobasidium sp. 392]